jgi:DNA-binding NarL/FixJ family response regulator
MAAKMISYFSQHPQISAEKIKTARKMDILTKREKEILAQVIKGLTNREIASTLFISENTVKNHLRNIMEKLQMSNRVQAATFALQEGWLREN